MQKQRSGQDTEKTDQNTGYCMYSLKLKHDDGEIVLKTAATSPEHAKKLIMALEGCPERAIQSITPEEPEQED